MPRGQNYTTSEFYCVNCSNKGIPIIRKPGHQREPGHLKKLYCLHCGQECNFVEIRPFGDYKYEDFLLEYEYGNFDKEGNRIIPYRQFLAKLREESELMDNDE